MVYYEGRLMEVRTTQVNGVEKKQVKVHFKGWQAKFDEWIDCDSNRFKLHNNLQHHRPVSILASSLFSSLW